MTGRFSYRQVDFGFFGTSNLPTPIKNNLANESEQFIHQSTRLEILYLIDIKKITRINLVDQYGLVYKIFGLFSAESPSERPEHYVVGSTSESALPVGGRVCARQAW